MNLKECTCCGEKKDVSSFYVSKRKKNGDETRMSKCKECVLEYNRILYYTNPEYQEKRKKRSAKQRLDPNFVVENRERGEKFYYSLEGRAKTLLKSAQRRSHKYEDFDLDLDFIRGKLLLGVCEVTNIPFSYDKPTNSAKNKYSPSIDRIDSSKGYVKSNCRIVIWQYNLMKGEISDDELFEICKLILKSRGI